jgi:hypothetical protein
MYLDDTIKIITDITNKDVINYNDLCNFVYLYTQDINIQMDFNIKYINLMYNFYTFILPELSQTQDDFLGMFIKYMCHHLNEALQNELVKQNKCTNKYNNNDVYRHKSIDTPTKLFYDIVIVKE